MSQVTSSSPGLYSEIEALYDSGLFLKSLENGKSLGAPETWADLEGMILGGRLIGQLGNHRLSRSLLLKAYRRFPRNQKAIYYYIWAALERYGAIYAWEKSDQLGPVTNDPALLADWHGQRAQIASMLRDFQTAEVELQKAAACQEPTAWFFLEQHRVARAKDHYDEAEESILQSLKLNPDYPSAIRAWVDLLEITDREEQAVRILEEKSATLESCHLQAKLANLYIESERYDQARRALDRFESLAVYPGKYLKTWKNYQLFEIECHQGNYSAARELGPKMDEKFFEGISKNINNYFEKNPEGNPVRKKLNVGFVRQNHLTCAPATLSTLSRFWNLPVDHLSIAEEICYDGTSSQSERKWAEQNGFYVREFSVTWESAVQLISMDAPFTLATASANSGHLQAVIGFDEAKRALLIRDPFERSTLEFNIERLLETHQATGPRGMLMVPVSLSEKFKSLRLPDEEEYDHFYRFLTALDEHQRKSASSELDSMIKKNRDHRLTLQARVALASYDSNPEESCKSLSKLNKLFPKDTRIQLNKLYALRQIGTLQQRLEWLEECCEGVNAHPLLRISLARELILDDRNRHRIGEILQRVRRTTPDTLEEVYESARYFWLGGDRERAMTWYRFAACLGEMREAYVQTYFNSARLTGRVAEALVLLEDRIENFGSRSPYPVMSLFASLSLLDRHHEGFQRLEETLAARPDDGELGLFAARKYIQFGKFKKAGELLQLSKRSIRKTDWLREMAALAKREGRLKNALDYLNQSLELEPLSVETHTAYVQTLADCKGRSAALKHLEDTCIKFPHQLELNRLWYEWSSDASSPVRMQILERVHEIDPSDAWTLREKGLLQMDQGQFEPALQSFNEAIEADQLNAAGYVFRAHAHRTIGNLSEANEDFRLAICLSADNPAAIRGFVETSGSNVQDRKSAITYIEEEMVRQTLTGEGLQAFRQVARGVLTPEELRQSLKQAHESRPDLLSTWTALSDHLTDMNRLDEALEMAKGATESFPLVPVSWLKLSEVYRRKNDQELEVQALKAALEINPDWVKAITQLSDAYTRKGDNNSARNVLENALEREPNEAVLKGYLADYFHKQGEIQQALKLIQDAVELDPDYEWGWEMFREWGNEIESQLSALETCQRIVEERPEEIRWKQRLTELRLQAGLYDESIDTANQILELNPSHLDTIELKAIALTLKGDFQKAEEVCQWKDQTNSTPIRLRAREGWVDYKRGARKEARRKFEALLEDNPDHAWSWNLLVELLAESDQHQAAINAAEKWAWLCPDDPRPLGWLGMVRRNMGESDSALEAFRKASRLDPSYTYAFVQSLEICWEKEKLEDALRILEQLSLVLSSSELNSLKVRHWVESGRPDKALDDFKRLCMDESSNPSEIAEASEALIPVGRQEIATFCEEQLSEKKFHPMIPYVWSSCYVASGKIGGWFSYRKIQQLGESGENGIYPLVDELAERISNSTLNFGNRVRLRLVRFLFRDAIQRKDQLWGKIGYILVTLARYKEVVKHMADWKIREHVEGWMIHNLTLGYFTEKNDSKASELLEFSINNAQSLGETASMMRIWASLDSYRNGAIEKAVKAVHLSPEDLLSESEKRLRRLAVLLIQKSEEGNPDQPLSPGEKDVLAGALDSTRDRPDHRLVLLAIRKFASESSNHWLWFQTYLKMYFRSVYSAVFALGVGFLMYYF